MKTYKLTFKCLSTVTKLPDAQVIFGAVCNIIKHTKGEDELERYFNSFNQEPLFVHSSMYPQGKLPMAKMGLMTLHSKNKEVFSKQPSEQLTYLSKLKQYKKINYVNEKIFFDYLCTDRFEDLKDKIKKGQLKIDHGVIIDKPTDVINSTTNLVVHNNSEEKNERGLYYDMTSYYDRNSLFSIYIKTSDIKYVKEVFAYSQYFGFGNRISVGKNSFELVKTEKCNDVKNNGKMCVLLSKCIDDSFDLENSSYMINSSDYLGSKYYSSNRIGTFNTFVEGSYMQVIEKKEYYGKLIKSNNGKDIYHYGIGFVM